MKWRKVFQYFDSLEVKAINKLTPEPLMMLISPLNKKYWKKNGGAFNKFDDLWLWLRDSPNIRSILYRFNPMKSQSVAAICLVIDFRFVRGRFLHSFHLRSPLINGLALHTAICSASGSEKGHRGRTMVRLVLFWLPLFGIYDPSKCN